MSGKIKNVADVSTVERKIQNNSRSLKAVAENSNRQPNAGRSAGNSKPQRNNRKVQRKIQIAGWRANVSGEDLNCRAKI